MWPDRISNPGPLIYESGALPTALRGPATQDGHFLDNLEIISVGIPQNILFDPLTEPLFPMMGHNDVFMTKKNYQGITLKISVSAAVIVRATFYQNSGF